MLLAERTYTDGREEVSRYVYGNGLIGEEKTTDEASEYATYLYNHLGSTTAVTDENGTIIETYDYGAYGELLTENIGLRRFLYNGQLGVVTDENGLYHMRARYYNTDIKRFISRDIVSGDITNSQSINRYCYVQGNPLSYTDPFGLSPQSSWCDVGHTILDVLGFVPGLGVVADIANAIWYFAEGRTFDGITSLFSALPGIGDAVGGLAKVAKVGCKMQKAALMAKGVLKVTGNMGSFFISGVAALDSALDIYHAVTDPNYEGDVWQSLTNFGLSTLGTIFAGKGLADSAKYMDDLAKGRIKTSGCFVAGTSVLTADGFKAIEEIEVGDTVLAENAETGEQDKKEVLTLYRYETYLLIHIHTEDGDEVVATKEHPFYVEGAGFVSAGSLKEGDVLQTADGRNLTIVKVEAECLDEPVTVYNFEVEDYHTYFVGENGLFVHNQCDLDVPDQVVGGKDNILSENGKTSVVEVELSRTKYPESVKHIEDAIASGQPDVLTIGRGGARNNRKASLKGIDKIPGMDLDEYPPAMSREGGKGASVRGILPSDNRGSGSSAGHQLRGYPDGTKYKYKIID